MPVTTTTTCPKCGTHTELAQLTTDEPVMVERAGLMLVPQYREKDDMIVLGFRQTFQLHECEDPRQ